MKIVLSRKGFDTTAKKSNGSHYGMLPSPMLTLDSGRQLLVSVPIPEVTYLDNKITYGEIRYPHPQLQTMGDVVGAWAMPNSVTANTRAHLDPDLDEAGIPERRVGVVRSGRPDLPKGTCSNRALERVRYFCSTVRFAVHVSKTLESSPFVGLE
jgi:hypothetical protein